MASSSSFALIEMEQCPLVKSLKPVRYLGYRITGEEIEHLIEAGGGRTIRVKANCKSCLYYQLLINTHVLTPPIMINEYMRFIVNYNGQVRNIVRRNKNRLKLFKVVRREGILPTEDQKQVMERVIYEGESLTKIAEERNVSKAAISKLLRKGLRKAILLSP